MLLSRPISVKYILGSIKYDMLAVLIIAMVTYYVTHRFKEILPEIPLTIPTFIGTAISILLSFKLNQSYDRWWEARKIWGSIVNDSRTLVLQMQSLPAIGNEAAIRKIAYRQMGWCYCLGRSLRGLDPMEKLKEFVTTDEWEVIGTHKNVPLALLQRHTSDVAELKNSDQLDVFCQVQLDNTLLRLCDSMGRAERIKGTIFPVTYRLFLHLAIYLFVIALSISLSDTEHFRAPLLLLLSGAFFLLEKTATLMQDPFENRPTDTSMTAIARNIEINIRQLLNETEIPLPQQPTSFYIS